MTFKPKFDTIIDLIRKTLITLKNDNRNRALLGPRKDKKFHRDKIDHFPELRLQANRELIF